jgi:two-component system chemotaxis sensor kinase CheA
MLDEAIREFLIESNENLAQFDREMVALEQRPGDRELIASIFRTIHTIKGTSGFLGFDVLGGITHLAENLLSQVREGEREMTPKLASLILESADAVRQILKQVESGGAEGTQSYDDLKRRLEHASAVSTVDAEALEPKQDSEASANLPSPIRELEQLSATLQVNPVAPVPLKPDAPDEATAKSSVSDSSIRVDVGLLDKLMNLVGELVLARNQILQFNSTQNDTALNATSQRLNLITTELQEGVMKTRMQPIGMVWNKLPRVVRDLAASCGKQIRLEMDGAETELDKTIIEAIKDPLTHIVRNSCDHGIERPDIRVRQGKPPQGTLSLRAYHEGGHVIIEICDDGGGIDPERIKAKALQKGLIAQDHASRLNAREAVQLVFLPGFSTAESVTNISGRGVGMDVVKTNIEKIGGAVDLASEPGQGTTIRIKIPLTLAIIPGLVVVSGGERFVIPQASLLELVRLEGEAGASQLERVGSAMLYRRRGQLLPVAYLQEILQLPSARVQQDAFNLVVLQAEDKPFGLIVDSINDTQEIVVKPLGKQLKGLNCYAGATIMGDGKVALILDVPGIAGRSGILHPRGSAKADEKTDTTPTRERKSLLLFAAADRERLAVPLSLVARLEEFPADKVEQAGSRRVIQYRGVILPLVSVSSAAKAKDQVQVIVFADGERQIGLEVERIIDIVEESIEARSPSPEPGLLGSAVVGGKVTDFPDLDFWLGSETDWKATRHSSSQMLSVLIVDGRPFERGVLRNSLEMQGHLVVESGSVGEALNTLERQTIDAVFVEPGLPGIDRVRDWSLHHAPYLSVVTFANGLAKPGWEGVTCLDRHDRQSLSACLQRLATSVSGSGREEGVPKVSR